jgi:hypothetical protein
MKKWMVVLSVFWLTSIISAEQVVPLPDLVNPDSIAIDCSRVYITDDIQIYIYRWLKIAMR